MDGSFAKAFPPMRAERKKTWAETCSEVTYVVIPESVMRVLDASDNACHPQCCGLHAYGTSAIFLCAWVAKASSQEYHTTMKDLERLIAQVHPLKGQVELSPRYFPKLEARGVTAYFSGLLVSLERALDMVRCVEILEKEYPPIDESQTGPQRYCSDW